MGEKHWKLQLLPLHNSIHLEQWRLQANQKLVFSVVMVLKDYRNIKRMKMHHIGESQQAMTLFALHSTQQICSERIILKAFSSSMLIMYSCLTVLFNWSVNTQQQLHNLFFRSHCLSVNFEHKIKGVVYDSNPKNFVKFREYLLTVRRLSVLCMCAGKTVWCSYTALAL